VARINPAVGKQSEHAEAGSVVADRSGVRRLDTTKLQADRDVQAAPADKDASHGREVDVEAAVTDASDLGHFSAIGGAAVRGGVTARWLRRPRARCGP
jgi:hypothetical protein